MKRTVTPFLAVVLSTGVGALEAKSPEATCAATGSIVVSYDNGFKAEVFGNSPYPSEQKALVVDFAALEPGKSKLCWDILLLASAQGQFGEIRVKFDNLNAVGIFDPGGESNPRKNRKKSLTYNAEPSSWDEVEYPVGSNGFVEGKRVKFDVRIKLGNGGWTHVDPDIIIQKPGT